VNLLGALVGEHRFEVVRVPYRGYSSVTPLAPSTVLACLAMSMADLTLVILAMLTRTGLSELASLSLPRCRASNWDRYRSAAIQLGFA
jgi:hypothetical protein